ncbi:hypothetical protein J2T15_004952 [Paenibacillus harenae]|uniref:Uncharacterized protein n=1 Tax=Paenibacillus harenae TaxID=306543 RepID=A0ABT9U767_PAEHA|nr:hypothetical protein [Paenibacillus harenae]
MLQRKDHTGEACRNYIENNGDVHKLRKDASFRILQRLSKRTAIISGGLISVIYRGEAAAFF